MTCIFIICLKNQGSSLNEYGIVDSVLKKKEVHAMKYPYMTLPDETEITHGDMRDDGTVLVYIETPVDGGFNSAYCVLPSYECSRIQGIYKG